MKSNDMMSLVITFTPDRIRMRSLMGRRMTLTRTRSLLRRRPLLLLLLLSVNCLQFDIYFTFLTERTKNSEFFSSPTGGHGDGSKPKGSMPPPEPVKPPVPSDKSAMDPPKEPKPSPSAARSAPPTGRGREMPEQSRPGRDNMPSAETVRWVAQCLIEGGYEITGN